MQCLCGEPAVAGSDFCAEHRAEYLQTVRELTLSLTATVLAGVLSGDTRRSVLVAEESPQ